MSVKLAIGIPAYGGHIDMHAAGMYLSLGFALADYDTIEIYPEILYTNLCPVDHARNVIMQRALTVEADWLLTIDADVFHDEGAGGYDVRDTGLDGGYALLDMLLAGERGGAAVIGAAVWQRATKPERHRMAYLRQTINPDPKNPYRPLSEGEIRAGLEDHGGVIEVDRLSTSLIAFNVPWVRDHVPKPWFIFPHVENSIERLGEDLWFCDSVKKAGGKILCDLRFTPKHLGRPELIP